MFMATSACFPPAKGEDNKENGIPLRSDGIKPAISINGKAGGGSYTVNESGDAVVPKVQDILAGYIADGSQDAVWQHTLATFQRITGSEQLSSAYLHPQD